jgi:LacI family transcriptional regulator, galactose operon repressor
VEAREVAPTSWDIAKEAGVSQATVSRVLNGDPRVASETRRRVADVIDRLGYTPNAVARGLATKRTGLVGVAVSDVMNPFYPELLEAIEGQLAGHGLQMILSNTADQTEEAYTRLLVEHRVDGIVFTAARLDSGTVRRLAERRFPIVLANRLVDGVDCDSVAGDNAGGARSAAEHLLSLGHRHIGVLTGRPDASTSRDRLNAFAETLTENGIELDPDLVRAGWFAYDSAYLEATDLLSRDSPPTAVFCLNDLMALAALNAAAQVGRAVPRDLSIVGFDDIKLAAWEAFQLTTVRQPLAEMARTCADLIAQRIDSPDVPFQQLVFPSLLVLRRTSGPPARRSGRRIEARRLSNA